MLSRNVRLLVLTAIAGLGLAAPGAQAATRYTTPAPAVGADCSAIAPCDLPTAISGSASGDEVLIGSGTYTVTSDITVSGKTLSLRGAAIGPGRPVIDMSAALVLRTGAALRDVEMRFSSRYLRLEGGTVDRIVVVSTTNNSEDNCRIQGAATSRVTNSLCLKTIPAFGSTVGLGDTATLQLEGSTVVGHGVALYNGNQTASATNSILESSSKEDVNAGGGSTTLAFDAFVTTAGSPTVTGKVGTRATFVNRAAGDYRQAAGSSTIDAGTTSTSALDLNGNLRTLGAASDIGAYEFVPAPPGIAASVSAPTKRTATPAAAIDTKGGRTTARLEWGPTAAYSTSLPSQLIPAATSVATVTEPLTGLAVGTTYHYRWTATSDGGTTVDPDRTFTTAPAATAAAPTALGTTAAGTVLTADYDTFGTTGSVRFVVTDGVATIETPAVPVGAASGARTATAAVAGLAPRTAYAARLEATTPDGAATSAPTTLTTLPLAPAASAPAAEAVGSTGATLRGSVDTQGSAGTARFVLRGPDGSVTRTALQELGEASGPRAVSATVSGLAPATSYVLTVETTNAGGATTSEPSSFRTAALFGPPAPLKLTLALGSGKLLGGQLILEKSTASVSITCSSPCKVTVTGAVRRGRVVIGRLGAPKVAANAPAGKRVTVRLTSTAKLRQAVRRYLTAQQGRRVTIRFVATFTTADGKRTTRKVEVVVRRLRALR